MEKKNENTVKDGETMELTLDQMDKISAGGVPDMMVFRDSSVISEDEDPDEHHY